jgi:hypothetical protein
MLRRMVQSALCLCLSPLLIAQHANPQQSQTQVAHETTQPSPTPPPRQAKGFVTIPNRTKVELVALDKVSSGTASIGSPVRFAVANDIAVNGVVVLHAGVPVTGVVAKVKRGVAYRQWAELRVRVDEIQVGNGPKLRLTDSGPRARFKLRFKDYATCAALLPLCVASFLGVTDDGPEKPNSESGQQEVLQPCTVRDFWVTRSRDVPTTALAQGKGSTSRLAGISCPQVTKDPRTNPFDIR